MKKFWFIVAILAALPLAHAVQAAEGAEPVTVQLNWKHQFEFAAFYAAQAQGYYKSAGLNVTIREGGPGVDVVQEVVSGRADFAVGTSTLVVDRYRGQPVVALASMMQHSATALIARRGPQLESVHDLAGRSVAVDPHDRDEIEAYLRASGIAPDKIHLIDQSDLPLDAIQKDQIAAATIYTSNEPFLIRGREHEYLILVPRSAGIDLFGNILFTSEAELKSRPTVVKAFREATLKGLVYALEHSDELTSLILEKYNTQHKSRDHLKFEAEQIRELTRPDIVEPGYMSPGRWRHAESVYAGQSRIPADFDLSSFIYDPNPPTIPVWLLWSLVASITGLVLVLVISFKLRNLNSKLRLEIVERAMAQIALHQSESKYRELVSNANAIILKLNVKGEITYFNEFAEKFFGFKSEEILGRPAIGTIVPSLESETNRDLQAMMKSLLANPGDFAANENENMTRDGRRVMVHWTNRLIRNLHGEADGLLCIGQDVTAQKVLERELARHRNQLEELVARRTSELELARRDAERLARVKSEFLANMSHEIRTPLNGVLGLAKIGLSTSAHRVRATELFQKITDSGQLLLGIINDVLDFSKIDAGHMTVEHECLDLFALLEQIIEFHLPSARAKGLSLNLIRPADLPTKCQSDALRLQQVLNNLISNAIKFTETGSIEVLVQREVERLRFQVRDSGVGMTAEACERVFHPFEQADGSMSRRFGGTGLGLTISRRLVELMGGTLEVDSRPGIGSTFQFAIPYVECREAGAASALPLPEQRVDRPLQGLRLLAAEDNEVNQIVLEEMLRPSGAVLTLLGDGQQLLDRLAQDGPEAFDLVLMDVQMPVMDGLEATRLLLARWPELKVVGQTAHAFREDRDNCLNAGMVDTLVKPFTPEELITVVLRHARRRV